MVMVTIGNKMLEMPFKVSMEKQCKDCVGWNGDGWCKVLKIATRELNFGCKHWITDEMLDAKLKREQQRLEATDGLRVNYMLTLMFSMISASYQIMVRSETIMGKLIGGKDWRFERKKALKDIMKDIKHIQTLYSTYFETDYVAMMSDYGRQDFDDYTYDGFQMFCGDLLMLGLTYFEHGYRDNEVLHSIIKHIRETYPNQLNLFPPEFVEQFEIKCDD